ncbi:hypothetical protein LTR08_008883 [Meristemomyces frigidus]|nr:hypothetical protein LTR08_008883 [Meristemomyces frigidus]
MAQQTKDMLKPADNTRTYSHGRGGAGNINAKPSTAFGTDDFKTPTLKSATYTTGRGGTGNMALNADPSIARASQDVDAPAHHDKEPKGTFHWGRGGEGNVMTIGQKEARDKSGQRKGSKGAVNGERRPSFQGVFEKGKELLGLGKGKGGEGAVVDE